MNTWSAGFGTPDSATAAAKSVCRKNCQLMVVELTTVSVARPGSAMRERDQAGGVDDHEPKEPSRLPPAPKQRATTQAKRVSEWNSSNERVGGVSVHALATHRNCCPLN